MKGHRDGVSQLGDSKVRGTEIAVGKTTLSEQLVVQCKESGDAVALAPVTTSEERTVQRKAADGGPTIAQLFRRPGAAEEDRDAVHAAAATGISGSGKSSLMRSVLRPLIEMALARKRGKGGDRKANASSEMGTVGARLAQTSLAGMGAQPPAEFSGAIPDVLEAVREVDQAPIGKTSRSTPATYLGDSKRSCFSSQRRITSAIELMSPSTEKNRLRTSSPAATKRL